MDNVNGGGKNEKGKKRRIFPFSEILAAALEKRKGDPLAIFTDISVFIIALVFARSHLIFGAHPLAIAFLAVLPTQVWVALLGAVTGALTLGGAGFVYAIISVVVVFLRIVTSSSEEEEEALFNETVVLRMAAALIGGFTAALYEILLTGFSTTTLAFGLAMTFIPPIVTFAVSGMFTEDIGLRDLLLGRRNLFDISKRTERERYNIIFFQCSAALGIFFLGFALKAYSFFGISVTYVFAGLLTLVVSKRFGALRAAGVGFFAVLGVSAMNSVSFALAGLASGLLFVIGMPYAIVGGGAAVAVWSIYSGGFVSLVSVFPEYVISAVIGAAILKKISIEKSVKEEEECEKKASEMVGTMGLTYRSSYRNSISSLEGSLLGLSSAVKKFSQNSAKLDADDYKTVVSDSVSSFCKTCPGYPSCRANDAEPYDALVGKIATRLMVKKSVEAKDFDSLPAYCHMSNRIFEVINEQAAKAEAERFRIYGNGGAQTPFEMFSRLISDAITADDRERTFNPHLTEALGPVARDFGPEDCVVRVFGERKYHVIAAGDDVDGTRITAPEFKQKIEETLGTKIGSLEFFRDGKTVLMQADSCPSFTVECEYRGIGGKEDVVSGDTVKTFKSSDDRFYAVLSDGMGSGKLANETSTFVCSYLSEILDATPPSDTVLRMLSHIVKNGGTECSATVDLFSFDLINGEASFLKSGAAPSYVKRKDSIFRIRSETAPIGLMKRVDTEKIVTNVDDGDYVIMLSDGVSQSTDDATWLLEMLAKPPKEDVGEYADEILAAAIKHSHLNDDMTVVVAKVVKAL